jgi:ABC-2 type transport system permease protein
VNAVVTRFVLKDLYFARTVIAGAIAIALLAIPLLALGPVGRDAAFILMVCAGAIPASFICMALIVGERKERANLFTLSLPISGRQSQLAKMLAAATAYLLPWTLLILGTFALFGISHAPRGMLPLGTMVWVFLLDQFCLTLAVTMTSPSEGWVTMTIIFCSVSISFYFYLFISMPQIAHQLPGATAVWTPFELKVIAVEVIIAIALVLFALWRVMRRKDFV